MPRLTTVQQPMVKLERATTRVLCGCLEELSLPPIAVRPPVKLLLSESSQRARPTLWSVAIKDAGRAWAGPPTRADLLCR